MTRNPKFPGESRSTSGSSRGISRGASLETSHPRSGALPFAEPERPAELYTANIDGAARGNPGPASYGVILRGPDGATKFEIGKYIGRTTNNVAEYYGLIAALDYAAAHRIERLRVISDSELLVRQMQGRYKVKSADLRPLHERAQKLARGLAFFAIEHVRRERNADADALANVALDRTSSGFSAATHPAPLSGAARSETASREPRAADEQRVRVRYSGGALHPLEPLELGEGETVEIRIRRK